MPVGCASIHAEEPLPVPEVLQELEEGAEFAVAARPTRVLWVLNPENWLAKEGGRSLPAEALPGQHYQRVGVRCPVEE
jgi:hypothetical protein